MKKLLLLSVLLIGCTYEDNFKKPYIIVGKFHYEKAWKYDYIDKAIVLREFYDTKNYSIGDTIN